MNPTLSNKSTTTTTRLKLERQSHTEALNNNSSIFKLYNTARANALPLTKAANYNEFMSFFACGDPNNDPQQKQTAKVSLSTLLSYSTRQEKWLMALGIFMATIAGLGIPAWLLLLARALDTFSNLAVLIERSDGAAGLYDLLEQELLKLCIAFACVGVVCLFTGFAYVSIWTYTGEKQALRIQKEFVRACLNQDAAWFDLNDRDTL